MVTRWSNQCKEIVVSILYKHGREDQTAKSRLVKVPESRFANDLALYTVTQSALESASRRLVEAASCSGLTVSLPKTIRD